MQRDGAISRRQIHSRGIVQRVGFRPFVFNLAQRVGLNGYVRRSDQTQARMPVPLTGCRDYTASRR